MRNKKSCVISIYDRYGTGLEMLKMKRKRGQVGV
jgi:hypothetical protein